MPGIMINSNPDSPASTLLSPSVVPLLPKEFSRAGMESLAGVGIPHLSGFSDSKSFIDCSSTISMIDLGCPSRCELA